MSTPLEEPTVTEREAVSRERAAWVRGVSDLRFSRAHESLRDDELIEAQRIAREVFPFAPRSRLRIVHTLKYAWRCIGTDIQWNFHTTPNGEWRSLDQLAFNCGGISNHLSTSYIELWADLLKNPTEPVP